MNKTILLILFVMIPFGSATIGSSCVTNANCDYLYYTDHGVFYGYCDNNICTPSDGMDGHRDLSYYIDGYTSGGSASPYFGTEYGPLGNQRSVYDDEGTLLRSTKQDIMGTGLPYMSYSRESGTMYMSFDSFGNTLQIIDNKGNKMVNEYDGLDRLIEINYYLPGESIPSNTINYYYDYYMGTTDICIEDHTSSFNLLCEVTENTGSVKYLYDKKGRIVWEEKIIVAGTVGPQTFQRSFEFNTADKLIKQTLPNAKEITYNYDNIGQLTNLKYDGQNIADFTYEAFGGIDQKILNPDVNGIVADFTYDDKLRLVAMHHSINGLPDFDRTLKYDIINNVRKIAYEIDITPGNFPWTGDEIYTYDNLYRLRSASYSDTFLEYEYKNKLGDRELKRTDGNDIDYYYSNDGTMDYYVATTSTKEAAAGTTDFSYDENGNVETIITSTETKLFTYDAINRLIESNVNGQITHYFYDFENNRILKILPDNTHIFYLYHGGQVIMETTVTP